MIPYLIQTQLGILMYVKPWKDILLEVTVSSLTCFLGQYAESFSTSFLESQPSFYGLIAGMYITSLCHH